MANILILLKKTTTNPKNEDDKCFPYAVTVALNFEEIESHLERVSNITPFINKYNSKRINCPSKIDEWKAFDKNNPTFAVNILYIKEKDIFPAYILEHNNKTLHNIREKQIIS